ncbi:MAG: hypothetical protein ACKVUS_15650 [Saprospiraceae bacterium]
MEELELLKKVGKVDAPPFLLTRIQAKIRSGEAERLPLAWGWAGGLAFGLLLLLNVLAVGRPQETAPAKSLAQQLQMTQTEQLYADQN